MIPTYVFIALVTMISTTPMSAPAPFTIMKPSATADGCEKAAKAEVARLTEIAVGQKYGFTCIKFQVGP